MTRRRLLGPIAGMLLVAAPASTAWGASNFPFRTVSVQLGLRLVETTEQLRKTLGVKAGRGALVLEVEAGGAAGGARVPARLVLDPSGLAPVGGARDSLWRRP